MLKKKAPEFNGVVAWINSKPLQINDLIGKVVVIDFWTYTCVNCLRTLPHIKELWNKYKEQGLIIIGVHTPEFEFEKDIKNVENSVKRLNIEYPVAVDSNYSIWESYGNHYWPRQYLLNSDGMIVWDHIGEGGEEEIEDWIRKLLGENKKLTNPESKSRRKSLISKVKKKGNIITKMLTTPETYAGYLRNNGLGNGTFCQPGSCSNYKDEGNHLTGKVYLNGSWLQEKEYIKDEDDKEAYFAFKYSAKQINAVLGSFSGKPYEIILKLDNDYLTNSNKGYDVKIGKDGISYAYIDRADMYNLVDSKEFGSYDLKIITKSRDFMIFAFTFG